MIISKFPSKNALVNKGSFYFIILLFTLQYNCMHIIIYTWYDDDNA